MKFLLLTLMLVVLPIANAALPEEIVVNARYDRPSSPRILEGDNGEMVAIFMSTVVDAKLSHKMNDLLHLAKAENKEFISPELKGCELLDYSFDYIGHGSVIVMFGGRDAVGVKNCQKFVKSAAEGFQMRFTNVPLYNGGGVVKSVLVNVTQ